ncbi:VOC family protein [Paracoccaceae bacterium GXU_MW_L88]
MTSGIHHVTAMTRKVQANVDFYVGFLGLRLVKQTGGFEDADQLHLIYGDALGSPGSLLTFLVWEDGGQGRVGHGQVGEIALAVPKDSVGEWMTRAMRAGIRVDGPRKELGETVLRLKDPDGIIVKLVGSDRVATAPLDDPIAPTGVHAVTLFTENAAATADFLTGFGYRKGPVEGAIQRMESDTDVVDVRDAKGFFEGVPGTGTIDHVAFRAADVDAVRAKKLELARAAEPTNVHDRKYFLSLYVREPAGILFEYATDAPGVTVDEPADALGQTLMIPPGDEARAEDLRVLLPQFALPGEERTVMRDLPFVHRFHTPETPDGSVIILLHGTGGNESDLMPLAARINPNATLLGVRGRSTEEGILRYFRRITATSFDQEDIRSEARAFEAFLKGAVEAYDLDPEKITVLGYSNGANFAAAVMALSPGLIRRAVLMRPMAALEDLPEVDLSGTKVLTLSGESDPYGAYAPRLVAWLNETGADLDAQTLPTGHGLTAEDLERAQNWTGWPA